MPANTIASDTFARANVLYGDIGKTEDANHWQWGPTSNPYFGISSQKAYCYVHSGGGPAYYREYINPLVADCTVSCDFPDATYASREPGISFRGSGTDMNNHLFFAGKSTDGTLVLSKVVAGVETALGSNAHVITNGDNLSVVLNGSSIKAYYNGTNLAIDITSTFNQTATQHGMFIEYQPSAGSTSPSWDNFLVTTPAAATGGASLMMTYMGT